MKQSLFEELHAEVLRRHSGSISEQAVLLAVIELLCDRVEKMHQDHLDEFHPYTGD